MIVHLTGFSKKLSMKIIACLYQTTFLSLCSSTIRKLPCVKFPDQTKENFWKKSTNFQKTYPKGFELLIFKSYLNSSSWCFAYFLGSPRCRSSLSLTVHKISCLFRLSCRSIHRWSRKKMLSSQRLLQHLGMSYDRRQKWRLVCNPCRRKRQEKKKCLWEICESLKFYSVLLQEGRWGLEWGACTTRQPSLGSCCKLPKLHWKGEKSRKRKLLLSAASQEKILGKKGNKRNKTHQPWKRKKEKRNKN